MARTRTGVIGLAGAAALLLAAMSAAAPSAQAQETAPGQGFSGAYLAARQAARLNDFDAASRYYTIALSRDASNIGLKEELVLAQIAMGRLDRAATVARTLEDAGNPSQLGQLSLAVMEAQETDYAALIERIEAGRHMGELLDQLVKAWALVGSGDMSAALEEFDKVIEGKGTGSFGTYHKALALAHVGDLGGASELLEAPRPGSLIQTRRGVIARIEVLSMQGKTEEALALIERSFGPQPGPELAPMKAALEAGETLQFDLIDGPRAGIAEVYFTIAGAIGQETAGPDALLFAQAAAAVDPGNVDATLLIAQLLEGMGQFDAATAAYRKVPYDHPAYHVAELGRAETLRQAGKQDAAIEVMEQLAESHAELAVVHSAMGDLMRSEDRWEEAVAAYDRALELRGGARSDDWRTFYTRGIVHERLDNWDQAETDFRRALEIRPGEPNVLNYLGYSLVEQQRKLGEALEMIERAVAARPESGFIIDSLGWALFRLGRYEEAVPHMERAAELMSIDPVINDHLGDVYWAVGRKLEARFQWKRALSFIDHGTASEDADPERIRRKLEKGLDAVLEEEGAEPLQLANDET